MNAEKYFKTRNLYEILQVEPDAQIQEGTRQILVIARLFIIKNILIYQIDTYFYPMQ